MIVDQLQTYLNGQGKDVDQAILQEVASLAAKSFARQFGQKKDGSSLRLSSIGRCVRQQAYGHLGFEKNGKEIDARAKMVFFQGDIAELAIIQLMKVAELNVSACQDELNLDGIPGHPDGIFQNEAGKYLLEVKSMSSYSFDDFTKGVIDEGYLYQINSYLEALGLDECVMVGLNKDAGVLHEHLVKRNPFILAKVKENIQTVKSATKENLPSRPYSPDAKGHYPWQCLYCSFRGTCLPSAQLVLEKNKYRLKNA